MPAPSLPEAAFPSANNSGITMRDYFAAAALSGLLTIQRGQGTVDITTHVADAAYTYADAMLRRRLT
jgi:hypothetical protein